MQFQKRFYLNQFFLESKEWISWPFSVKNITSPFCSYSILLMIHAWGNCCQFGCKALATKFWQVGLLSIPWGNTVYWNLLWGPMWLGKGREKVNPSRSKGCKDIFKKQSCKSVIIMCQFWGTVVGDGIPGCSAPMGFIDALTFLRSVKSCHLLDFMFITIEFQGE